MDAKARLLERKEISADSMAFRFEKPAGYSFRPGQFCFLTVPDLGFQDERGLRRHFSIACSPLEADLVFAMKMSGSALKKTLRDMPLGTAVELEPPRGEFTLPDDVSRPLCFLAGGIGITPFRAMLRHIVRAKTGHRVVLFYSNRTPEESAFLEELLELAGAHPEVRVVATMTRIAQSARPWSGLSGRLNPAMVREGCPEWQEAAHFIAGPPAMAEAMRATLDEMGIAEDRLHLEKFGGY